MIRVVALLAAATLAGCATVQPQQTVATLDAAHPKYATEECRMARMVALNYDDNQGGRMGAGLALGLFLGPFGLPFAAALDANQAEKRNAVNGELVRHCGAVMPVIKAPDPNEARNTGRFACGHGVGPC